MSSLITPQMRQAARVVHADAEPFATIQDGVTDYPLTTHGKRLRRLLAFDALHVTNWQGRVQLSNQPRTNHVAYSDDLTQTLVWTYQSGGSLGTGRRPGPDDDGQLFEIVSGANASGGTNQLLPLAVSGESVTVSAVVAPTGDQITRLGIYNGSGSGWAGYVDTQWTDGIPGGLSSPGAKPVSYQPCGDGAYIVSLDIDVDAATPSPAIHFHCDRNAVENAYVGYLQVVDAPGIYIPTADQPATRRDYSRNADTVSLSEISGGGYWIGRALLGCEGELRC